MAGSLATLVPTLLLVIGISPAFSEGRRLHHVQTPDTYTMDPGLQTSPALLQMGGIRDMVGDLYEDKGQQVQWTEGPYRAVLNDINDNNGGIEALLSLGIGGNMPQPLAAYSPLTAQHVPLGDPLRKSLYISRHPLTITTGVGLGETLANSLSLNRLRDPFSSLHNTAVSYPPLAETVSNSLLLNRLSYPLTTSYPTDLTTLLGETLSYPVSHKYSLAQSLLMPSTHPTVSLGETTSVSPLALPLTSLYSNHLISNLAQTYPLSLHGSQGYPQFGHIQNLLSYRSLLPSLHNSQVFGGVEPQTSAPYFPDVNLQSASSLNLPLITSPVSY